MIRPGELENRDASTPEVFTEVELALIDALTRAVLAELREDDLCGVTGGGAEAKRDESERQA